MSAMLVRRISLLGNGRSEKELDSAALPIGVYNLEFKRRSERTRELTRLPGPLPFNVGSNDVKSA
jgi:hypothetical protein